jgi:hypothetical protein
MGSDGKRCYNYTHAEKEDNHKLKELAFKTGDEVTVEFDPVHRKVAYAVTNNGGQPKGYEQSIGAAELLSDSVHFCVCLIGNGEVTIK